MFPGTQHEFQAFVDCLVRATGSPTPEAAKYASGGAPAGGGRYASQYDRPFVALAFANMKVYDMAMNWAATVNEVGMPHCLVALDEPIFEAVGTNASATPGAAADIDVNASLLKLVTPLDGSNEHKSGSWRAFAEVRLTATYACILLGYNCMHSDIDVVWLENPIGYLRCEPAAAGDEAGAGADDCDGLRDADIVISSDNLSPARDRRLGVSSASGILNTGIFLVYYTERARALMANWAFHLQDSSSPLYQRTSDQQIFNAMIREPDKWPGLEAVSPRPPEHFRQARSNDGSGASIGFLPLDLFSNSHVAFVQSGTVPEDGRPPRPRPLAVHATYTLGGSFEAKRARFRNEDMWYLDGDEYRSGGLLAIEVPYDEAYTTGAIDRESYRKNDKVSNTLKMLSFIHTMRTYGATVRGAAVLSMMLGLALVMPPMACACDKVWGGHDNIFKFGCRYPGADDADYLPIENCQMDALYNVARWDKAGVRYKPAHHLDRARAGAHVEVRVTRDGGDGAVGIEKLIESASQCGDGGGACALDDLLPPDAAGAGGAEGGARVDVLLSVDRAAAEFLAGQTAPLEQAFRGSALAVDKSEVLESLRPDDWCAECHYDNCDSHLSNEVLALGRIVPTRGDQEKFCVSMRA